jgi:hypothetical protein
MYPIETQTFLDGRIGHPANSAVLVKSFHMPELVTPASSAILGKCFHMAELGTPADSRAGKGRGQILPPYLLQYTWCARLWLELPFFSSLGTWAG